MYIWVGMYNTWASWLEFALLQPGRYSALRSDWHTMGEYDWRAANTRPSLDSSPDEQLNGTVKPALIDHC